MNHSDYEPSTLRLTEDEPKRPSADHWELVRYEVVHHSDRLPEAEAICPTQAVVRDNGSYRIDQGNCIKCDACREQAPYSIKVVDEVGP